MLLRQGQKDQDSQKGCPGSSMQGTSKITPRSNFNLSTYHCSSLEQKQPEIAASREAQPPGAGGGDSGESDGDFCSGWCSPFHFQALHPRNRAMTQP